MEVLLMNLYPASLTNIAPKLRSGEMDLIEYVEELCRRVEEIEPHVHALLPEPDRSGRLLREAAALQERFPTPEERPPLYGIPVGIKDLFNVDGLPTQAGSNLPAELFAGPEASIVSALRTAGALILGKTAMDEFAYADPSPTRNPHNLSHTPGGSSSGSAAAVATGLCPLGIGTQTTRSITAPASFCGVVGYKPSFGRLPIDGTVLLSPSLDTVGFLTQDVESMESAASLLINGWKNVHAACQPTLGLPEGKFMSFLLPEAREQFEQQVQVLEQAGYTVKRVEMPWESYIDDLYPQTINMLTHEMAQIHSQWVQKYATTYRQSSLRGIQHGQTITAEQAEAARAGQLTLRQTLDACMTDHGIDLWITPAQAGTAPEGYTQTGWGGMTIPWSYAGLPTLSLPGGEIAGMPLGFQCIARFAADEHLIAWSKKLINYLKN
jgi:Asp-tRNA(Asn)/Glu-tRNA(Gln) amidotransferase A subunit family amidase